MIAFPDTLGGSTGLFLPGSSTPATTVGELRELIASVARMTAAKDKAVAALKRFEWTARGHEESCPECHNLRRFSHAGDCDLGRLIRELEEPSPSCCGKPIEVKKIIGGGESWFYAMCECGKILGA